MSTVSIRLNKDEEKILKNLTEYFNEDQSKIVKKSLMELHESITDLKDIDSFEKKEKSGKAKFFSVDEMFLEKK